MIFKSIKNKDLTQQKSHTLHLGHIIDETKTLDEVLVSIFKGPNSSTGENTIEISCHGSTYIQQQIIQLLLRKGCRMANPGEFTLRAFLNGKLDLSQAEAVADQPALALTAASLVFVAPAASAATAFAPTQTVQGTPLVLQGAGTRYRAIFKVYDMALYLPRKVRTADEVLAASWLPAAAG